MIAEMQLRRNRRSFFASFSRSLRLHKQTLERITLMFLIDLLSKTTLQVWHTLSVNWMYLLLSAVIAAVLKLYVNQDRVAAFLQRNRKAGVLIATGAAVTTPLCSCGTTAIILGMMAGSMPWAPIVAFMVSSPLTSPQELVFSAGLFGWNFALAFFLASILLGLAGGAVAYFFETHGWLTGQARFKTISGGSGLVPPRRCLRSGTTARNVGSISQRDLAGG
jgi:uncharacterized protein